jgi:hypothetical protein
VQPAIPIAAQRRRITRKGIFCCIPECTGRHYLIIAILCQTGHDSGRKPSYTISPVSPSTVTGVPFFSRSSGIPIRSIIGIPPMIAPVAMIASASVLMIAAGA